MLRFAWPYFFALIPLLWMIQKYWPYNKKNDDVRLRIPFLSRIQMLNQTIETSIFPQRFKQVVCMLIWLSLVVACANPVWLGPPLPITHAARNIMFAIDVSPSMQIPDLNQNNQSINRLQSVKEVAAHFINKRRGDKLGLILFGSKAYLETPLTLDRKTVSTELDDATIGLAGNRTAIGDAIALAVKKFSTENIKSRILILLTDGGNNSGEIDPIEAAELAKKNQIKIYTVGIGASQMVMSGMFGQQVVNPSADLDENLLKKISTVTQGEYFRAQDDKTLGEILEAINKLEPIDSDASILRPVTSLFYWPLAFALLLILILIFPNLDMK